MVKTKTVNKNMKQFQTAVTKLAVYHSFPEVKCPDIALPNNTRRIFNNRQYLRRTRYHCTGGRFPGGDTVYVMQCDNNGQWNREPALSGCQGKT